jgi:hypothetical protein
MYTTAPVHLLFEHISSSNSFTGVHVTEIIDKSDFGEMVSDRENLSSVFDSAP